MFFANFQKQSRRGENNKNKIAYMSNGGNVTKHKTPNKKEYGNGREKVDSKL